MKLNPFESSNLMSLKDASRLAIILTLAEYFTVFMVFWGYEAIISNIGQFCYETIVFICGFFFTKLIAIAGLTKYLSNKSEK